MSVSTEHSIAECQNKMFHSTGWRCSRTEEEEVEEGVGGGLVTKEKWFISESLS